MSDNSAAAKNAQVPNFDEEVSSTDRSSFDLKASLLARLLSVQSYTMLDLKACFQGKSSDAEFGLALWDAREQVREDVGIEFISHSDGVFVRATDAQKLRRGQAFWRTGLRKQKRSLKVLDAVEVANLSSDERLAWERARERQGRATLRAEQEASLRKPPVTVCEVPRVPKRRP